MAAALAVEYGVSTYAIKGEDRDTYYGHIQKVIDFHPQITMDDGADVVGLLHTERTDAPRASSVGPKRPPPVSSV